MGIIALWASPPFRVASVQHRSSFQTTNQTGGGLIHPAEAIAMGFHALQSGNSVQPGHSVPIFRAMGCRLLCRPASLFPASGPFRFLRATPSGRYTSYRSRVSTDFATCIERPPSLAHSLSGVYRSIWFSPPVPSCISFPALSHLSSFTPAFRPRIRPDSSSLWLTSCSPAFPTVPVGIIRPDSSCF